MPEPSLLFVTGEYPPDHGGVGDYTARLRQALREQGTPSRVLTRPGHGDAADPPGVQRWDARFLRQLARVAPPNGIVHLQYQPAAFDLRGEVCVLPLVLRVARPDIRVATTFHDVRVPYLFPGAGPLRPLAVRLLARTSHAVVAADPRDLAWLGRTSPRHHLVPIGSNVPCSPPADSDRAAFRASLGFGPQTLVVAYFGFLNSSKGLDSLLDTWAVVRSAEPNARLLLVGGAAGASDPTDLQTEQALATRLASSPGVTRTGYLDNPRLSAHLLAADLALLPYADGASPRRGSLLACLAHGLPVVTTEGPGLTPALRAAVHPSAASPDQLAAAAIGLWRSPQVRARLSTAARALADAWSWPAIAARHRQIYTQLMPA